MKTPRVLLFSHDSFGLGHLRRTLTIAESVARALPQSSVLVVTGSPCATQFRTPDGVELIKLPAATKDDDGRYVPRCLGSSLSGLLSLRSSITLEVVRTFKPHVCVVDHQPIGLEGELTQVLEQARAQGCRTILGLRDIIDDPAVVATEWARPAIRAALRSYDRICVYGCPTVFDQRSEYPIPPELSARVEYVGYVLRPSPDRRFRALPGIKPSVLVTTGGGADGRALVETYLDAIERDPPPWESVLVLGPLLDSSAARRLKRRARRLDDVRVHTFYEDMPRLYTEASAAVAMAGYNSVVELLAWELPTVLVPRTHPRREQLLRAERLEDRGLVRCLPHPTPSQLSEAVRRALDAREADRPSLPLDGASRVVEVVSELLEEEPRAVAPTGTE